MAECEKMDELICAYLDGELDEAERSRIERHLSQCERCRSEFEDFNKLTCAAKGMKKSIKIDMPGEHQWHALWENVKKEIAASEIAHKKASEIYGKRLGYQQEKRASFWEILTVHKKAVASLAAAVLIIISLMFGVKKIEYINSEVLPLVSANEIIQGTVEADSDSYICLLCKQDDKGVSFPILIKKEMGGI